MLFSSRADLGHFEEKDTGNEEIEMRLMQKIGHLFCFSTREAYTDHFQ